MKTLRLPPLALILLLAGGPGMSQPNADHGLKGDYYTGVNFDRKVFSRIDPNLNFNWRGRTPGPGIDRQFYSVRWTGQLHAPTSGMYRFTVEVDDGVRVWVGNKKIIDAWNLHDNITFTGSVMLEAGKTYDLRVDYFNDILEGEIKLYWVKPEEYNRLPNSPGYILSPEYLTYKPTKPTVPPVITKPVTPVVTKPAARTVTAAKPPVRVAQKPDPVKTPAPVPSTGPITAKATSTQPDAARPNAARPDVVQATAVPPIFDKLATGAPVVLTHVLFRQSEYVLLPDSYPELDKLVLTLKAQPALRVDIGGHTDNVGDQRLNQTLSEYRAKVVANYLIQHGIAEERVRSKGYGGSRPLNGNATEAERISNRRVEFTVW
jgi:outer membrane protein OmpA-like peptidoglycan-associated protein